MEAIAPCAIARIFRQGNFAPALSLGIIHGDAVIFGGPDVSAFVGLQAARVRRCKHPAASRRAVAQDLLHPYPTALSIISVQLLLTRRERHTTGQAAIRQYLPHLPLPRDLVDRTSSGRRIGKIDASVDGVDQILRRVEFVRQHRNLAVLLGPRDPFLLVGQQPALMIESQGGDGLFSRKTPTFPSTKPSMLGPPIS